MVYPALCDFGIQTDMWLEKMEDEIFKSEGIQPWQTMELNCASNPLANCSDAQRWDASSDQSRSVQFGSAITTVASSPATSNSNNASENAIGIGNLGRVRNSNMNSAEISPHTPCTVLPSPGSESLPMMVLNSSVAGFLADLGFAEGAAGLPCPVSRNFSGLPREIGTTNPEISPYGANYSVRLSQVSSSPSSKSLDVVSSQGESSVSDRKENCLKGTDGVNPRKRKVAPKGKAKESATAAKVAEEDENSSVKRRTHNGGNGLKDRNDKAEDDEKKAKDDVKKLPEPPKDYIHVRARRGQATDRHSLAERVRRERISERMKVLQGLVPGCNEVIGKVLILDEIINYIQSLQRQVEFLYLKLASVNTSMDSSMDDLMTNKVMLRSNNSMPNPPVLPLNPTAFHGQDISDWTARHCTVDPFDMAAYRSLDAHFPQLMISRQYEDSGGADLQSMV